VKYIYSICQLGRKPDCSPRMQRKGTRFHGTRNVDEGHENDQLVLQIVVNTATRRKVL